MALKDWIKKAEEEERKNREAEERRQQARKEIPVDKILSITANRLYEGMCERIAHKLTEGNTVSDYLVMPEKAHIEEYENTYIPLVKEKTTITTQVNYQERMLAYTYEPQPEFYRFWDIFQSLARADGITVEAKIQRINKSGQKSEGFVDFGHSVYLYGRLFTPACTARPVILYTYTK